MSPRRALPAWLLAGCLLLPALGSAQWWDREAAIMGTRIQVQLWHEDAQAAQAAIDAVLAEFRRLDRELSPFKEESELSLLNREAARHPVVVSDELFGLLKKSLGVSVLTGGAFDISFASVGHWYDYREGIAPSDEQVAKDLPKINYRDIVLNAEDGSVFFRQQGLRIDLGGIAKGYAVDRAIALLQQRGIEQALVTAGGDSRLLGDRRGRPWNIGIRAPRDPEGMVAVLPLSDSAISTSGDYERYFERDGVRHHHIISPKTGRSAREVESVTILGSDATTTDALSTSVFVLGPVDGMELINRLPGLEAVIIDKHGKMLYSDGLKDIRR